MVDFFNVLFQKLKVLRTLNEVSLTLSELSDSGVGRAVRLLKSQPGELGQLARGLVIKWKALLDEHMMRENIQVSELFSKQKQVKNFEKASVSTKPVSEKEPSLKFPPSIPPLKASKRHLSTEPIPPSLDASSGLSFEQAMSMSVTVKKKAKKRHKPSVCEENEHTKLKYPSRAFTQEILSSLSDSIDLQDTQRKVLPSKPSGRLIQFY